ncbi:MAG: iron ABC transporter permease [Microscillaceae bacterium]
MCKSSFRPAFRGGALFLLLLGLWLADIGLGSVYIPPLETLKILLGLPSENPEWADIIWKIRFPRAATALLVGMALALSGLQMQTLFLNPLAGPGILGITAGASLGVALVMFFLGGFVGQSHGIGLWSNGLVVMAAILGAGLVMALVMLLAARIADPVVLLLLGLMLGNLTLALVSLGQYFSRPETLQTFLLWSFGSLGGVQGDSLILLSVLVGLGILLSFWLNPALDVMLLGPEYAQSLGLPVKHIRLSLIFITGLLAGGVTAFCGPIGFVGVAVPHLARALNNTSRHQSLTWLCLLCGASLMLLCDLVAKGPGVNYNFPINAITALIGSPILMVVILKSQYGRQFF